MPEEKDPAALRPTAEHVFAARNSEQESNMSQDNESRRVAIVTLQVAVHVETDPGINTPDVRELPYEYLVVRAVRATGTSTVGSTGVLQLIEFDGFPDHDPDNLILEELSSALLAEVAEHQIVGDTHA